MEGKAIQQWGDTGRQTVVVWRGSSEETEGRDSGSEEGNHNREKSAGTCFINRTQIFISNKLHESRQ